MISAIGNNQQTVCTLFCEMLFVFYFTGNLEISYLVICFNGLCLLVCRSLVMAQPAGNSGWLRGKVKAVPSGDTLVIMGFTKAEIPPEKTVVLAHLSAPRLVCYAIP